MCQVRLWCVGAGRGVRILLLMLLTVMAAHITADYVETEDFIADLDKPGEDFYNYSELVYFI